MQRNLLLINYLFNNSITSKVNRNLKKPMSGIALLYSWFQLHNPGMNTLYKKTQIIYEMESIIENPARINNKVQWLLQSILNIHKIVE